MGAACAGHQSDAASETDSPGPETSVTEQHSISSPRMKPIYLKVVLLGDSGVGKTSLCKCMQGKSINPREPRTYGVELFRISLRKPESKEVVRRQLWDLSGQIVFRGIMEKYINGSDAVVIAYDVTNRASFKNVPNWLEFVQNADAEWDLKVKLRSVLLVGNKSEGEETRSVSFKEGKHLADKLGIEFAELSAKARSKEVLKSLNAFCLDVVRKLEIKEIRVQDAPVSPPQKERVGLCTPRKC